MFYRRRAFVPRALEVRLGASRVDLRLPRPSGLAPVRIGGGGAHVQVTTE